MQQEFYGVRLPSSQEESDEPVEFVAEDYETIAAVVTGGQQGAVSIVRLSGMDAVDVARRVFLPAGRQRKRWTPISHRIYYGAAVDASGKPIDEVLLLPMLEPRSYTAEDVVELHTHGGGLCAQRVLHACLEAGARLARPGEFTLRAFLNGRLDLSQAESVTQLLGARTVAAADSALAGLAGGLGGEVAELRAECLDVLAEMDARLDFDEDLPPLDVPALASRLKAVASRVLAALRTAQAGRLLRSGLQVALVGRPNVGKSSLLNALSGSERAIVTEVAGTTRDIVEAGMVIGGVPVTLLDTAGLRESADLAERIGVQRSRAAAQQADIVIMVADAQQGWTPGDHGIFESVWGGEQAPGEQSDGDSDDGSGARGSGARAPALLVLNKADLAGGQTDATAAVPDAARAAFQATVVTSAATGEGLDTLRAAVLAAAGAPELAPGGVAWAVNERQAEALLRARDALARVLASVSGDLPLDFWTIDLRAALLALGEVSGDEVGDEVLSTIFARFCIGK